MPHGAAVEVANASADTKIRGRIRELDTKTASGDLMVRGEVEGNATIKTVSGDAILDRIYGSLAFTSVSGDVVVREVGRDVEGKSVAGDVRIESTREGRVSVQSVSGDIEIGVSAGTNLDVDAGSVSGTCSRRSRSGAIRTRPAATGRGSSCAVRR